jgi:L-fuculose-phosphate aldolase
MGSATPFELSHPADQIVGIMNRIYYRGYTTTSGGNLSVLDDSGDMWISPSGIDKGNLNRNDICCVRRDGSITGPKPSVEQPFHASVYQKRGDLKAVLHAHPPALVALSILRKLPELNLAPAFGEICGPLCSAEYAVPGSKKLGDIIAAKFEAGFNVVILENHGVCVGAENLLRAFMIFETLETAARIEINARRLGVPKILGTDELAAARAGSHRLPLMDEFETDEHSSTERAARSEMIRLIRRAYDRSLFISTLGSFSVRVSAESFLITPHGKDRAALTEADLTLIAGEKRERGKIPSETLRFHQILYARHPKAGAIIFAQPPHIMGFAVSGTAFDHRTIPESYMVLRHMGRAPYEALYANPEALADRFSPAAPAFILDNNGIVVAGKNPLNAFDQLEVAEATAQSLILAKDSGTVVPINDREIAEIDRAFGLE